MHSTQQELYICDMPPTCRQLLCEHLDELDVWQQLAASMSLTSADITTIRRKVSVRGSSASQELLNIWGGIYHHTVTELFVVFKRQKLFQAMRLIKDLVERKYHVLIPSSQPVISELLANRASVESKKILNCSSSSGVSNSINEDTSDHNYTNSSAHSSQSSNEQYNKNSQSVQHSNYLSESNILQYASSILEINYAELTEATNNWSDAHILGTGGFGIVYRGYWKHTEVAIKQIHYRGGQMSNEKESAKVQLQQSLNELKYLNSCRHDNVLPLYGYSIRGDKPCLVYQLMKGGSLEQRLNAKKEPPLSWQQRIDICVGTARGINFLHSFREKPLIHGDIKPANVLLDQCLQPKIGDFGLAREGPNAINSAVEVTQVFGTKPYLPPEFLHSKKLSTQVDTYSFGVVLLETFTGMRAYDKQRADILLTKHIMKLCASNETNLENLVDRNVPTEQGERESCTRIIQLGIECIADSPHHRPEMEMVLKRLHVISM